MTTIPQPDAEDSDAERLLLAFRAVTSPIEMIRLAAGVDAAALDALEQNVERTLADLVASDDANSADAALRERLESLREIRQQDVAALAAQLESATATVAQHAQALADRLVAWIQTPGWDASEAFLQEHADELLTDASAATLQMLQEANQGNEEIALHIKLLAACQEQGIAAAYAQLRQELAAAVAQGLADRLVAWIQTPDWEASEVFINEHTAELLTDAGAATLELLQEANEGNQQIALHIKLLAACREQGTGVAYNQLRQEMAMAYMQALADRLIAWMQISDWDTSEAFLQEHADELLNDDGTTALQMLKEANQGNQQIVLHIKLLEVCRERGIEAAYAQLRQEIAARATAAALHQRLTSLHRFRQPDPKQLVARLDALQDLSNQGLAVLLQVTDGETLAQVLAEHPLLLEYPGLARFTEVVEQTHTASQTAEVAHALPFLTILLEQYNYHHVEKIDPDAQQQVVDLHVRLLPVADAVDAEQLGAPLRRNGGWALNTLGNHYAQGDQHQAAVDAYSRGLEVDGQNAMLYRNRAGERIALGDYAGAQQDIEMAGQLEPEAARLPQLWCELYATQSDSQALITEAGAWSIRQPENAQPHFYLALAALLTGDTTQGQTALAQVLSLANADDRQSFRETLARLQAQWPDQQAALQQMLEQFQEETP